jgi:hypothetical protein
MIKLSKEAAALAVIAGALIERTGWVQGHGAVDANGKMINARADGAVAFCALGALWACYVCGPIDGDAPEIKEICSSFRDEYGTGISDYNDQKHTTKEEMVSILTRMAA